LDRGKRRGGAEGGEWTLAFFTRGVTISQSRGGEEKISGDGEKKKREREEEERRGTDQLLRRVQAFYKTF